jgi:hypothetical protein
MLTKVRDIVCLVISRRGTSAMLRNGFGQRVLEVEAEKQEEKIDPKEGRKTKDTGKRPGSTYQGSKKPARRRGGVDFGETDEGEQVEYVVWRWPTWHHNMRSGTFHAQCNFLARRCIVYVRCCAARDSRQLVAVADECGLLDTANCSVGLLFNGGLWVHAGDANEMV